MKTPIKPNEEILLQKLKGIKLSSADTIALRTRLLSYADLHEMPEQKIRSPYSIFYSYSRIAIVGAMAILLIVGGTGVSFAAQNTLPGQALYAVKVDVAEPLQSAFITSPVAKAEWQNTLAERRLEEASTLAAQNNLSSSTEAYIGTQVAIHVQASEQDSDVLAAEGEATSSLSTQADLQARLDAHTQLLATITSRLSAAGLATTSEQVARLIQNIDTQRDEVAKARQEAIVALVGSDASSTSDTTGIQASSTDTAASDPSNAEAVAYVRAQDTNLHAEEATIFQQSASLLLMIPPPIVATTTASTSPTTTDSSTDNSQDSEISTTTDSTNSNNTDSISGTTTTDSTAQTDGLNASTTVHLLQPWRKLSKSL
jgi:hypothetical protein